jgi:molecular chaperone DnaK
MVHMVKKSMTEYGDKLDAEEKAKIEAAIKDVEDVLRDGDKEVITAKTEALAAAAQKLGEKMYAQQQAEGARRVPPVPAPRRKARRRSTATWSMPSSPR